MPIKKITALAVVLVFLSFTGDKVQKKVIRNKEFDIHFYVLVDESKTIKDKMYYWYKSGEIHNSYGASSGKLLHLDYTKYFRNNQLAEKGSFHYGLKSGLWKKWYGNGVLKQEHRWRNGEKNGECFFFDETGSLARSGRYNKNLKDGIWIDFQEKDTTWFEAGIAFPEPPKTVRRRLDSLNGKQSFFKRITKPFKKLFGKKKDSLKPSKKEGSFLQRLFKKKNDTLTQN